MEVIYTYFVIFFTAVSLNGIIVYAYVGLNMPVHVCFIPKSSDALSAVTQTCGALCN